MPNPILFSFRTELERVKPGFYATLPVECSVHLDFEKIPCLRVVCTENVQWYYDDQSGRATGDFEAFAGDVLFISGTRINTLQGDERETLRGLAESELQAYQSQRQDGLDERWFRQYEPKFEYDQRRAA